MRRASWMSLGMMVTRLAWMAQRLVSSKSPTRYASAASCSAATADDWKRRSVLKSCAISRTSRWNGSFRISSSVLFWYLRISRSATVPGRKRCGFFTPPVAGADLRAAFVASCFRGALPPVDLRAVCFVRAIGSEDARAAGVAGSRRSGEDLRVRIGNWDENCGGEWSGFVEAGRRGGIAGSRNIFGGAGGRGRPFGRWMEAVWR
ncbi:hypothetical protein BS78_03G060100 [Paspalum vaginatum]|nr:hypothetical protein BS78_03G060100 [Paspalum vaginatum]